MDDTLDPVPSAPDELLRMVLVPSDGRTPLGTLALIQMFSAQLAEQTGVALSLEADQHRPEEQAERSRKIVAAESRAAHAIDQTEAANRDRIAERDRLLADSNVVALAAQNAEALDQLQTLLAEMAAAGYAVKFELKPAEVMARTGE